MCVLLFKIIYVFKTFKVLNYYEGDQKGINFDGMEENIWTGGYPMQNIC